MGFMDKLKRGFENKIDQVKNQAEDTIVGKIFGNKPASGGYTSNDAEFSQPTYTPQGDPEHDAKMEEMRKQKEMRAMELEMQMQERMMAQGGLIDQVMGAQAGVMNAATEAMKNNPQE